jgi:DNA recombination protein RmuC
MEILIIVLLATVLIFQIFLLIKKQQNPNQNLEKTLENGLNQTVLTIIEKNTNETNKIFERLIINNSEIEKQLQNNFSSLKLEVVEKISQNQLSTQENITKQLNQSSLNLLEQSKIELSKIQSSNKESIESLIALSKEKLDTINQDVQKRLDENFNRNIKSFEDITKNLGQIEQKAQSMIDSTKSIDKLNSIFGRTASKAFGSFAESYLESMLEKYLDTSSWKKQVKLQENSDIIDFMIYFGDKTIGIDSKFPMTKYNDFIEEDDSVLKASKKNEFLRTVKEMSKSLGIKYLKTRQIDVLLLYLPSDSMYLECLNEGDKYIDELTKYGVTLISPNTLFPQILILQNYQNQMKISQNADLIIKSLGNINRNILAFRNEYEKLGDKIRLAQSNYDNASRSLDVVSRNILTLQSETHVNQDETLI